METGLNPTKIVQRGPVLTVGGDPGQMQEMGRLDFGEARSSPLSVIEVNLVPVGTRLSLRNWTGSQGVHLITYGPEKFHARQANKTPRARNNDLLHTSVLRSARLTLILPDAQIYWAAIWPSHTRRMLIGLCELASPQNLLFWQERGHHRRRYTRRIRITGCPYPGSAQFMLRKLYAVLPIRARRQAFRLLGAFILVAIIEVTGIAAILPFMALAADPEGVNTHHTLHRIYVTLGFSSPRAFVTCAGLAVLLTLAAGNAFSAYTTWRSLNYASGTQHELSQLLLRRYVSRRYLWFVHQNTAVLSKNVLGEVNLVVWGVLLPLLRLLSRSIVCILIIVGLVCLNPLIAVTTAVILGGAYSLVFSYCRARMNEIGMERPHVEGLKFRSAREALSGIKTAIMLGRESFFVERYSKYSKRSSELLASQNVIVELPRYFLETLAFGGVICMVLFLLTQQRDLRNVMPILSVFTLAAYRLMPSLQQAFSCLSQIRMNTAVLDKIYSEFFEDQEGVRSLDGALTRPLNIRESFSLEGITFSYPESSEPVIRDLSLTVEKNTTIAFVGSTGAGKTTLVDIILGLLEPDAGSLLVDGVAVNSQTRAAWQRNIGYVSQDIYLVDDTIRANIGFGLPDEQIDTEALEQAARIANLDEFINTELPNGYDTVVGERGVRLSGGQRQRIGIARALYHDPEVLILDEATSSLDGITESSVMEAVQRLSRQKTIVIIAHRLTTVQSCNIIYVLSDGRISSQGTFAELMDSSASFRAMAKIAS